MLSATLPTSLIFPIVDSSRATNKLIPTQGKLDLAQLLCKKFDTKLFMYALATCRESLKATWFLLTVFAAFADVCQDT